MNKIICFGEILWDFLPKGKFIGGAPFNVAFHLNKFGNEPILVSSVGKDKLGKKTVEFLKKNEFQTKFVSQNEKLETGKVVVEFTKLGEPIYKILENSAWDSISVPNELLNLAKNSQALVFGSLALREGKNLVELQKLLRLGNLTKFFDVNLRFPFVNKKLILELMRKVDFLKVNEEELYYLSNSKGRNEAIEILSEKTKATICVTLGEKGAILVSGRNIFEVKSPKVKVKDIIGAGDAFWASFVNSVLRNENDFSEILTKACKLGSLVVAEEGATPNLNQNLERY
ncbi:MAG: carbohydrate kinase [Calditrichaeota bacterium]|nr:MAG: carbohydrate kinase [Calditrichota bacterium]